MHAALEPMGWPSFEGIAGFSPRCGLLLSRWPRVPDHYLAPCFSPSPASGLERRRAFLKGRVACAFSSAARDRGQGGRAADSSSRRFKEPWLSPGPASIRPGPSMFARECWITRSPRRTGIALPSLQLPHPFAGVRWCRWENSTFGYHFVSIPKGTIFMNPPTHC